MSYTNGLDNPELYFQVKIFAGTGSEQSITLDGDENLSPNLVWFKNRTITANHALFDTVRGATKVLGSNTDTGEATEGQMLKSFNTDGFTVGTDSTVNDADSGNINIVSWNWKETATAGFDIVSYTGQGDGTDSSALNVSHSLSSVPHWILIKNRADSTNWYTYHHKNTSAPETEAIFLNLSNATSDDNGPFADTAPTSSVFTVGGDNGTNGNSDAMIAYLWSEKKGFSKFGSYTGNGNANGSFVYTGFKPSFVLIKNTNDTADWTINDTARDPANVNNLRIFLNTAVAENSGSNSMDMLSNGFKLRSTDSGNNASGNLYIYTAFAESPFVNSKGIPTNAR